MMGTEEKTEGATKDTLSKIEEWVAEIQSLKKKSRFKFEGTGLAIQVIGKAAASIKTRIIIPLINDDIAGELKELGFGVYCRKNESGVKEYCVTWVKNPIGIPEGFELVE